MVSPTAQNNKNEDNNKETVTKLSIFNENDLIKVYNDHLL